jgi:hypothetical protein
MKNIFIKTAVIMGMLTLASCNNEKKDDSKIPEMIEKLLLPSVKIASVEPQEIRHGDPTNKQNLTAFSPSYDVIVYFSINNNILYSSVQYFSAGGSSFSAIKPNVERCLARLDAAQVTAFPTCQGALKATDFSNFTFKAPSNVVFVTRSQSMRFSDNESLVFGKKLLNEHSGYNDGPQDRPEERTKAKPNKSFYNANLYDVGNRKVLYVQNYYTRKSGNNENGVGNGDVAIGPKPHWYAMNIFVTMDQGNGQPSKHIIDPDGGNMGNGNP